MNFFQDYTLQQKRVDKSKDAPDVFDLAQGAARMELADQDKLISGDPKDEKHEKITKEMIENCDPENNHFDKICYERVLGVEADAIEADEEDNEEDDN